MTAVRWWVKAYARWIARVQAVQGQLNLFFTAMSGVSLASGALKFFGAPTWVIGSFLVFMAGFVVVYTYLYSEGGVWNQQRRDSNDMSTNFAAPTMLMDDVTIGVAAFVALHGRKPSDEEAKMIEEAVGEQWGKYRNGIDIEKYDGESKRKVEG